MTQPTAVYLVEDHTDPEPPPWTRYWATVYLSRMQARIAVEISARRRGLGTVSWDEATEVSYAHSSDGSRQLYRVVPLQVHPEHRPVT